MRNRAFTLLFIVLLAVAGTAIAEDDLASSDWTLDFSGYAQERHDNSIDEVINDRTRLRFSLEGESLCSFHAEFDVSGARRSHRGLKDSNWLQKAWTSCQIAPKTRLDSGRVFPESGFSTFWPGGIITARYPGMYPWSGYYAYGVSVKHNLTENWDISGTLSGRSDLQFDDPLGQQFDRLELAGRVKRSINSGYLGFTTQSSDDFFHTGVDFGWKRSDVKVDGGVFYSDADDSPLSGFGQVEWLMAEHLAVHLLTEERTSGDAVITTGVGIRWEGFYLVGDYEENFSADEETFLVGLRYNW